MRGFSQTLNVCAPRIAAVVACALSFSFPADAGSLSAGTMIRNVAEATFFNPALGLEETVISNPVEALVAAVPALEISGYSELVLSRGAIGQYYFDVENTGNVALETTLSIADVETAEMTREGRLYHDVNANGVIDSADLPMNTVLVLAPGGAAQLIYEFQVASEAQTGMTLTSLLSVSAISPEVPDVPVSGEARGITHLMSATLELEKTQAVAPGQETDRLTYTLHLRNNSEADLAPYDTRDGEAVRIDGTDVSGVLLRDTIPLNTQFAAPVSAGGMVALYHLRDAALHDYVTALPADLSLIDAVAFFHDGPYPAGYASDPSFSVISAVDLGAISIENTAVVGLSDTLDVASNTTVYARDAEASLGFFDPDTGDDMTYGEIGTDTALMLLAGGCNASAGIDVVQITLRSLRTGDVETVAARETGANTGVFTTTDIPLVEMDLPRSQDGVMATTDGDRIEAYADCGTGRLEDELWVNPGNFLFNSVTNAPVAGAMVTLIDADTGAMMGSSVTDAQGFFAFDPEAANTLAYRLVGADDWVYPSERADFPGYGRIVTEAGYGEGFTHGGGYPMVSDIPVDPYYGAPLSLEKSADRDEVGIGEFVTYTLDVNNNMYQAIMHTVLIDSPAYGMVLVPGSVRFDGASLTDPVRDAAGDLSFDLGTLAPLTGYELSYTMQVTAAAGEGDKVNTALFSGFQVGTGTPRTSPVARAVVRVDNSGGVFAREGTVIGSVFMDCDGDGLREGADEPGIPGVRIVTDQGLTVVTDREGKYSLYGLSPVTHAFLVQPETLPLGTSVAITRTNDLGRGGSRLIPLRKGELRAEHFAVETCTPEALAEIEARRAWFDENAKTEALTAADLPLVGNRPATRSARTEAGIATTTQLSPEKLARQAEAEKETDLTQKAQRVQAALPLAELMKGLDNETGFIGLEDGQVMDRRNVTLRVKANMALTLTLSVNGREIGADRIGERGTLESRDLQALEYVAVSLRGGVNTLTLVGRDPFGIERERVEITLIAPGDPARIEIIAPETTSADPTTPFPVVLRLLDAGGRLVPASAVVTLEARRAIWDVEDIRPETPGIQAFIDNGEATFDVIPPQVSGPDTLTVRAGFDSDSVTVAFTPNLDERILIGVIEGAVSLGGSGSGTLLPASQFSGFEDTTTGLRGSLYLKGVIRGDTLLTLRYNSDRDTEARLFRDIRGDEYYPVYGDNSERGYDAQSSSNLYVKVEKGRSYVLYGDLDISPEAEAFKLGKMGRVVTGAKAHWSNERTSVTVFAARTSATQKIVEIAGRGVSGPYPIDLEGYVEGSERVEILVRDEDGGDILSSEILRRGTDYLLDFFADTITFDTPLHQFDAEGNPISVRVTFEVETDDADRYWIYGGEVNHALSERTMVGARLVHADAARGTEARTRLASAYVTHEAANGGEWEAEMARSEDAEGRSGLAARLSYARVTEDSRFSAEAIYTDNGFYAPSALTGAGKTQLRFAYSKTLDSRSDLTVTGEYDRDRIADSTLMRLNALYAHQIKPHFGIEIGAEIERRDSVGKSETETALLLGAHWVPQDRERTTVDARLRYPLTGTGAPELTLALASEPEKGWRVYSETEMTFDKGAALTRFALGFDYRLNDWLTGTFDLSRGAGTEATTYTQGLNAVWNRDEFTTFTFDIEHSRDLETSKAKLTSVALGAKWQAPDESWVGDADLEATFEPTGQTYYASLGMAGKVSEDLTFLGRSRIALDQRGDEDHTRMRTRLGLAYRPLTDPRLEVLAWYEHRLEEKHGRTETHMWSVDATYEASADLRLNGKYAGQYQSYALDDVAASKALTQLAQAGLNWEFGDDRFQIGLNASHLWDDAGNTASGFGAEIGYVLTKGMQIAFGYNHTRGRVANQSDLYQEGVYLRFNMLLDNSLWDRLDGFLGN
ncbi:putative repeat protein (TIGR01451 family) [Celeribacter persicus]|uniref:Putative repeat protein (TIGR01451 family) n=2 Tax=Celeribacter persicus TaxID=1651082 RepID=A0A2T5H9V6_9RHOB|nr:putative repeat protein (TIGR01451 family) [Celeribacter persicus]